MKTNPKLIKSEISKSKYLMGLTEETAKEKKAEAKLEKNPLTAEAKKDVIDLIKSKHGKTINDKDIHAIAEKHKVSPHKLESFIYTEFSKRMEMKEDMDKEMSMGKNVEKEHDPTYKRIKKYYEKHNNFPDKEMVFKWIASDHLDEFKDYYTRLKKMEKEAEKDKEASKKKITEGVFNLKCDIKALYEQVKKYADTNGFKIEQPDENSILITKTWKQNKNSWETENQISNGNDVDVKITEYVKNQENKYNQVMNNTFKNFCEKGLKGVVGSAKTVNIKTGVAFAYGAYKNDKYQPIRCDNTGCSAITNANEKQLQFLQDQVQMQIQVYFTIGQIS